MLSKKDKAKVRKIIREEFGHCNISKLKKHLKGSAIEEYDCKHFVHNTNKGISLGYTSNNNHFCRYFVTIKLPGMCNTLSLTKSDLTKQGMLRGCSQMYAL
jgi:hypothetical protein